MPTSIPRVGYIDTKGEIDHGMEKGQVVGVLGEAETSVWGSRRPQDLFWGHVDHRTGFGGHMT